MNADTLLNQMIAIKKQYIKVSLDRWLQFELFHYKWWICIALIIIPIVSWWIFVDKHRLKDIALLGFTMNVFASFLDVFGSEFGLWEYPYRLIPNMPILFPVDFIVLPVLEMFLIQVFPKWKGFFISNVILAGILAFMVEPLLSLTGMYRLITWKYYYSFPIYLVIAMLSRWISDGLIRSTQSNVKKGF